MKSKKRQQKASETPAKKACKGNGVHSKEGLAWILGEGLSIENFKERYFERKPLHVKRAPEEANKYYSAFRDIATPDALFSLLDSGEIPVYRVNMFRCLDGSIKETPEPPPQTSADVRRLFLDGWSIQWLQPQQEHIGLAKLVAILESQFGSLVGVNAYLTPPNTQGLAPHWDDVEVFVLQLSGSKSWQLHRSTTTSPLPSTAQTLPRYSSGDLPLDSLSPIMMKPKLNTGDLLYFPRGTIHHAPNQDKGRPSVHLTISSFQRQTLYDLAHKTFEEAMSELWETDETVRKALPWGALATGSSLYPKLCATVAEQLRRVADAVDEEAKRSESDDPNGDTETGYVAGALADLSAEFVQSRMPPNIGAADVDSVSIVSPAHSVQLIDPSALAMVPLPGDSDGSMKIVHCLGNSPKEHMMKRPTVASANKDESERCNVDGGEEEDDEEEIDGYDGEGDESECIGSDGGDDDGQTLNAEVSTVLKTLCARSPCIPFALRSQANGKHNEGLGTLLLQAKVPESAWQDVCGALTQLAAVGLVQVGDTFVPKHKKATKKQSNK